MENIMENLYTKWGREIDPGHVLQEYPRPSMVRDSYWNLNGYWDYVIVKEEELENSLSSFLAGGGGVKWDGKILVPFSPEAALSGVDRTLQPGEVLLYHRKLDPKGLQFAEKSTDADREYGTSGEFSSGRECSTNGEYSAIGKDSADRKETGLQSGARLLLHFGAVDQECVIYVDGREAGSHVGGYLPFTLDITELMDDGKEEHDLLVAVTDWTEERPHARGKQRLERKGQFPSLFYTPQSGIWQSVWMEKVPDCYVQELLAKPLYDEAAVEVEVQVCCAGRSAASEMVDLVIYHCGKEEKQIIAQATAHLQKKKGDVLYFTAGIPLPDFHPWSPEDPFLYQVEASLCSAVKTKAGKEDCVTGYFAMRRFSVEKDKKGIWRLFFNNKPYFFNGVLDQGYWPESLMTAPCEEALAYDIQMLKSMGFNTIRKHIKVEPERFYYLCDKMGMFVWQDMPNGGGKYHMKFTTVLPNVMDRLVRGIGDGPKMYKVYAREDAGGREQYYLDLKGMIGHLRRFPCIALWTAFNEGWGQFDARKAVSVIRKLDDTRFINEACGWYDQGGGDLYSIHNYWRRLKVRPQKNRVVALTEYGGFAWPVPEHLYSQDKFGYRYCRSKEELTETYGDALKRDVFPNLEKGLSAAIYTQTSDIETEINGLMTYDRAVTKMEQGQLVKLHRALQRSFREITEK